MRLLALDIATATGWARWAPGYTRPTHGTLKLAGSIGEKAHSFRNWLVANCRANGTQRIIIEAIVPQQGLTTKATLETLFGLNAIAAEVGVALKIPVNEVDVGDWRRHFIGAARAPKTEKNGRAWLKQQAIERCQRLGWQPDSDNAADALGLLDYWRAYSDREYGAASAPIFAAHPEGF